MHSQLFRCIGVSVSSYRGCPDKFLRKFQRSPFFLPPKSENSNAFLIPKTGPRFNWKREETKRATTNSISTGSPPHLHFHHPKSVDITSVKEEEKKLEINWRNGQMVPALLITVDKDNESGNKTSRKTERAELFWGNAAPACCQIKNQHTHTLNAHSHAAPGDGWSWEREGGKEETAGMLRSGLHFPLRPLGGRLGGAAADGMFPTMQDLTASLSLNEVIKIYYDF